MKVKSHFNAGGSSQPVRQVSGQRSCEFFDRDSGEHKNSRWRWLVNISRNRDVVNLELDSDQRLHNYEFLDNGLTFMLGGRLVMTKDRPFNIFIFAFICISCGLYFGFM